MIKVAFSHTKDEPRLSHLRKTIFAKNLYDEYLEQANIKLGFLGDERVSTEAMLTNPSSVVQLQDKMLNSGRYVFGFRRVQEPINRMIAIEKFEVRRGFFGPKFAYWAELSIVEQTEEGIEPKYMFSASLPDLGTKLVALFVQNAEVELLDKDQAKNALMQL